MEVWPTHFESALVSVYHEYTRLARACLASL